MPVRSPILPVHQSCQLAQPIFSWKYISRPTAFCYFDDISLLKAEITTLFAFKCELRNILIFSERIFSREYRFWSSWTGGFLAVSHSTRPIWSYHWIIRVITREPDISRRHLRFGTSAVYIDSPVCHIRRIHRIRD